MIHPNEILELKSRAPKGIYTLVAKNLGIDRIKVKNEIDTLKLPENYNQEILGEYKRLVEAIAKPAIA
jgi:hypothetical protein